MSPGDAPLSRANRLLNTQVPMGVLPILGREFDPKGLIAISVTTRLFHAVHKSSRIRLVAALRPCAKVRGIQS